MSAELRALVEAEVAKALAARRRPNRTRRVLVTEREVEGARKRRQSALEIPEGALLTPAARDRAKDLGISVRFVPSHDTLDAQARALVEAVLARVTEALARRVPRVAAPLTGEDAAGRIHVPGRVLTLASVRAVRGRTLVVGRRCAVTPAAWDELRDRGIELVRE